jgi:hypothetical protein
VHTTSDLVVALRMSPQHTPLDTMLPGTNLGNVLLNWFFGSIPRIWRTER